MFILVINIIQNEAVVYTIINNWNKFLYQIHCFKNSLHTKSRKNPPFTNTRIIDIKIPKAQNFHPRR